MVTKSGKSEGVPKETPERNYLDKLRAQLAQVLPGRDAETFVKDIVAGGYFALSLLEQKADIVAKLASRQQTAYRQVSIG